jgi:hypothetical protein
VVVAVAELPTDTTLTLDQIGTSVGRTIGEPRTACRRPPSLFIALATGAHQPDRGWAPVPTQKRST